MTIAFHLTDVGTDVYSAWLYFATGHPLFGACSTVAIALGYLAQMFVAAVKVPFEDLGVPWKISAICLTICGLGPIAIVMFTNEDEIADGMELIYVFETIFEAYLQGSSFIMVETSPCQI